jgi:hypothetical protein
LLGLALWMLTALATAMAAPPPYVTVGSDPDCDFAAAVPGAIASALGTESSDIRLVGGVEYVGQFALPGYPVSIRGGYLNCADAAAGTLPEQPQRSVLRPADFQPWVFQFNGGSIPVISRLFNVELRPSPTPAARTGKGLFARTANAFIELHDSWVEGFRTGGDGGGALITEGARLTLVRTRMLDNHAASGGAVACAGGFVLVDDGSELRQNRATSGNGGAIVGESCNIFVEARFIPSISGFGISANTAAGHGGAIHAAGGTMEIAGGPQCGITNGPCTSPLLALMFQNSAQGNGGAISLTRSAINGASIYASFDYVHFIDNRAGPDHHGGAIYADDASALQIGQFSGNLSPAQRQASCIHPALPAVAGHCVIFDQNWAGDWENQAAPGGGAAVAVVDSMIEIHNAMLFGNYAEDSVLLARGPNAELHFVQSVLLGDVRGINALKLEAGASGTIRQSFLESDSALGPTLRLANASLSLHNSYISHAVVEGVALEMNASSTITGGCNAVTGIESGGLVPGILIDRNEVGDFLPIPVPGSRLIDRCQVEASTPQADVQGNARVHVDTAAGAASPLDIGPYEYQGAAIFADGFEAIVPN